MLSGIGMSLDNLSGFAECLKGIAQHDQLTYLGILKSTMMREVDNIKRMESAAQVGSAAEGALFGKRDEAENRFKEAKRHGDPSKKEFDLNSAIRLLEDAITLKPHEDKYHKQFEKLKALKSDKAELLFKQVERYLKVDSSEFDMDQAIRLLEEVVVLKPYEEKYSKQLEKLKGFRNWIGK